MASEKEQLRKQEAEANMPEAVEEISHDAEAIKDRVGELVKDPEFRETLDAESLRGYEEFAKGEGKETNVKQMASYLAFMQKQFGEVKEVKKRMSEGIAKALQGKVITEKDRKFYQDKIHENVLTGNQIVTKEMMEKAEKELEESLKKRETERKEYDTIAHNPMVKNGTLALSDKEKIKVPDEAGFLKMSVPERRKFLESVRKAMPQAKKQSEKQDGVESGMMNIEYSSLLAKAKKDGLIGTKTEKSAMDKFKMLSISGKKEWIRDIKNGAHLKRFGDLWMDIRKTLKGESLAKMEKMRDTMGYKELLTEFGKMKEQEALKLGKEYDGKLDAAFAGKLISKHTLASFRKDFESKELDEKQDYVSQFEMQMARYKTLRGRIDGMKDKKAQATLNSMYESEKHGYTEINEAYEKFSAGKEKTSGEEHLREVTDITVKRGILQANELLNKQGAEKKSKFRSLLQRMTRGKMDSDFNGQGFQDNLNNLRAKKNEKREEEEKAETRYEKKKPDSIASIQDMMRRKRQQAEMAENPQAEAREQDAQSQDEREQEKPVNRIVDKNEMREQVNSQEFREEADVTKEDGFTQVATTDKENHSVRAAIVEINRDKSLKSLDRANQQQEFRGQQNGGQDKVSFSIKTDSGQTVELKLQQIRAMEKMMQAEAEEREKAA